MDNEIKSTRNVLLIKLDISWENSKDLVETLKKSSKMYLGPMRRFST